MQNPTMCLLARTKSSSLSSVGSRVLVSVDRVELILIVAAGGNHGQRTITYQVIFPPSLSQLLCALTCRVFIEVLDDALNTLNAHWAKTHGMPLQRLVFSSLGSSLVSQITFCSSEVDFRWAGNKLFLPGTSNNTIGTVYKEYQTGEMAAYYSPNDAKVKKALKNQLSMALELYVNQPAVSRNNYVMHWQRTHRYPSSLLNASIRQGPSWNRLLKVESEVPLQLPLLRSTHLSTSACSPLVVVSAHFQHFNLHSIVDVTRCRTSLTFCPNQPFCF